MEPEEILGKFKKKKWIVGIVIGAVILALTAWFTVVIAAWNEEKKAADGYYEVDPIVEFDVSESEETK